MDAIAIGAEEGHAWVEDCGGDRKTRYFTDVRMRAGREKPKPSHRQAAERWAVEDSTGDAGALQILRVCSRLVSKTL